ncbi:MAG: VOC family protein [Chloroflexota bacterium]|nr:VOC family protein [Chloroflexota bacterium]
MDLLSTHHVAIFTRDLPRMEEFYTQTLGMPVTRRWDDVNIVFIDVGSTQIELIGRESIEGEQHPRPIGQGVGINHLALRVGNTEEAFRELVEKGVSVLREPSDFQTVRIAFFTDPDGNVLELVQELDGEPTVQR